MPSIIFCYRILFGLQRKVSLGGGGSTLMSGGRGPFSLSALPLLLSSPSARSAPGVRPRGPGSAGASHRGAPGRSRTRTHACSRANFSLGSQGWREAAIREKG